MEKHDCRKLLSSLSEYVDGTLGESFCAEIEQHMEECRDCRIVVDSLRKTVYLFQENAGPAEVPDEVRVRLYRSLNLSEFLDKDG